MDANNFREFGRAAIDYIVDYLENIRDRDVLPSVQPGYLHKLLPEEAPQKGEDWKTVFEDIERVIMPGVTHWQSPNFHAYYPTATSYPSIVAEMLSASLGVVGFSWICSPACTELEAIVMDWVAKLLNLPKHFLHSAEGPGGGVIQGSASEAILVAVLTAREQAVKRLLREHPEMTEAEARGKLIAYSSDQSNSCVEKAGLLAAVPIKLLKTGKDFTFHGETLQKAVEEDIANGKVPIICITTLGTTGTCAFDDVSELAEVCQEHNIWLHVDAAYAGAALVLPEYKHLLRGLNKVDSINYNLHKTMMVNFDCCAMWLRNAEHVMDSFSVDRIYLKHNFEGQSRAPDYRHWQIPLGRRFRALKVWITLRTIGLEGIQEHVRQHIALAKRFETLVQADPRFEIVTETTLGLVCFRMKGENHLTKSLLDLLTERKKIYLIQAAHEGINFLRFVICGLSPKEKDIDFAWKEITEQAKLLLLTENQKTDQILTNGLKKTLTTMTEDLKNKLILNGVEKTK